MVRRLLIEGSPTPGAKIQTGIEVVTASEADSVARGVQFHELVFNGSPLLVGMDAG